LRKGYLWKRQHSQLSKSLLGEYAELIEELYDRECCCTEKLDENNELVRNFNLIVNKNIRMKISDNTSGS
jgi:hypothetical protein